MDLNMFVNTAWGRCLHCSTRARSRSPNGCGGFSCWRTRWPSLSQICSIGLRSGLCDGQFKNSTSWTTREEPTWAKKQPHTMRLTTANRRSLLVVVQGNLNISVLFWSSCESYFDHIPWLFWRLSIQQPTAENFFISLPISRCFVVLMQKNHCLVLVSYIENLVAKIRSVKFSFLLSIHWKQGLLCDKWGSQ